MWEDMYQMSLDTGDLGVERHASLPEMSNNENVEWKVNGKNFERRNSFTTIPNIKKTQDKTKGCRRRNQQSGPGKKVDHGYITQTFLNERITWDEELNISSKSSAVKSKKQTLSLKNSIQALLEANDSLVTDSYKTLNDAEQWSKSNDSSSQPDIKDLLIANTEGPSITETLENNVDDAGGVTASLVNETSLYSSSSYQEHESGMFQYSYTIDAELSYQEYNKLMHIIIMTLKEKRKWEEFIKEAEDKLETTNEEKMELLDNNNVLRESLEAANKAIKDISSKVQILKESLGPLRHENNELKKEIKELKEKIETFAEDKKVFENGHDYYETTECREEKILKETEMEEYKKNMHDKFRKLEEAYRNYRNEMECKHTDMNTTIDELKQLYNTSKCNVDELKNENVILRKDTDVLQVKNEQLLTEIKERWEADKRLITENTQAQIRYEHSQKIENDYKKQIKDTKEEIEKQKWEVFFFKEEATSLEKENKQLKTNTIHLEKKVKESECRYEMIGKERDAETQQNTILKGELEDVKKQLVERNDLKRKNAEVTKEMEIYRKQAHTLQELRVQFEELKRENCTQKSENEKLKRDVEKLKKRRCRR